MILLAFRAQPGKKSGFFPEMSPYIPRPDKSWELPPTELERNKSKMQGKFQLTGSKMLIHT